MKYSVIVIALALTLTAIAAEPAGLQYQTSWVGNSFGGKDGKFVQMDARCLFTTPDGTCLLNVPWEEGSSQVGIYKDGQGIGRAAQTHGWGNSGGLAVVANENYIFIAQRKDSEGGHLHKKDPASYPPGDRLWFGVSRRTRASLGQQSAPFDAGKGSGRAIQGLGEDQQAALARAFLVINDVPNKDNADAHIRGLAVDTTRNRLYVANPFAGEIQVFDIEAMNQLAVWKCENARQMAVDSQGNLWVVQGLVTAEGRLAENAPQPRIICFDADGKLMPKSIDDVAVPTGLAFDPQGRLLVSDNGPDQQVKIYGELTTQPKQVATFGQKGGILAGVAGRVEPMKLNGPQGVGCDSQGNIYVVCNGYGGNGSGLTLESYKPEGSRNWALYGLEFVDHGDFDPASDGQTIYTNYERFSLDYSKHEPGAEWSYQGFTLDRLRYPQDWRIHVGADSTWVRRISGKPFLFLTDMYAGWVAVYRLTEKDEIAVPCGLFTQKVNTKAAFPPNRPAGRCIWIDKNGDGKFDADEFDGDGKDDPTIWAWWVDSKGDLWQAPQDASGIRQFPCQGLNEHGVPIYTRASSVLHELPAPFNDPKNGSRIERVLYVPEQDVMYIGGYTPQMPAPKGAWKMVGRVIAKYENWSKQKRKAWEVAPDFQWSDNVMARRGPASFCVAGNYLFVVAGTTGFVSIHDIGSGALMGEMKPGPEVGQRTGWVDIPYGINAVRRSDGEYLVLVEEDERAKNMLYRFQPPSDATPVTIQDLNATSGEGRISLKWTPASGASSTIVLRGESENGAFDRIAIVNDRSGFGDRTAVPGVTYYYRVQAVGWGGAGGQSKAVSAKADPIKSLLFEDFEGAQSALAGMKIVPMPEPTLAKGGGGVGVPGPINWIPALNLPAGAKKLVIEYDRLFLKDPKNGCRTHYTRHYVNFNHEGGNRVGQEDRKTLTSEDAGKWTKIHWEVPIPEGVTAVAGGELNCLIEDAKPGYDNPVYIDNLLMKVE